MVLEKKCAVITGSAGGIGRATAVEMARQGARGVVVTDIDVENARKTVELVEEAGGNATFIPGDLRKPEEIKALMDTAAGTYGGIDILVNNAGLLEPNLTDDASIEGLPLEVWDMIMDVNLKAVWLASRYAYPYLRKSAEPVILNAGSVASYNAYPANMAYSASKAGVVALTKMLALELSDDNIRCVAYSPGAVETTMLSKYLDAAEDRSAVERGLSATHLARRDPLLGQPWEVAKLICFLASGDALFINGSSHMVDGGALAWRGSRGA
jgi:NAD(P)-dependent dehydrogenase (short-subunit alcohol dehydrogenase family)